MPVLLLVCGLCGVLLYVASAVVIPIALGVLFALVLSSPVEALHRKGLPRSLSAILILMIFLGLIGLAVDQLWSPAQQWLSRREIAEFKVFYAAEDYHQHYLDKNGLGACSH